MYQAKKEQEIRKKTNFDKIHSLKIKLSNINEPLSTLNKEIIELKHLQNLL